MPKKKKVLHTRSSHRKIKAVSGELRFFSYHIAVLIPLFLFFFVASASFIPVTTTIAGVQTGTVLGDEKKDEKQEEEKKEKQEPEEKRKGSQKQAVTTKLENRTGTFEFKAKWEGSKREMELETTDGQKIKAKIEDNGTTRIEFKQENKKEKGASEAAEIENETEEDELEEEDETEQENDVEIATRSALQLFRRNNIAAHTDFPLSVDPTTNTLKVTTPNGEKTVSVLPDQAVANMLAKDFLQSVDTAEASETAIRLKEKDGTLMYEVQGTKKHKFLGFIPVDTEASLDVSAQTGDTLTQKQSLLASFIDLLSF